jgi:hypothetical protein
VWKEKSGMKDFLGVLVIIALIGVGTFAVIAKTGNDSIREREDQRLTEEACARLCHPHVFKACSKVGIESVETLCASDFEGIWWLERGLR